MLDLSKVKKPEVVQVTEISKNCSLIVLEPFERGFGTTLMNPIRRMMLSSMLGSAIVYMKIEEKNDGYSVLEGGGVREDALTIALNLKGVHIKINNADSAE